MTEENSNRVGWGIVVVACLIDFAQVILNLFHAIPVIGTAVATFGTWLLTFLAWFGFYLYFKIKGVNFNTAKRVLSFNGGAIVECVPLLNALPAWTVAVTIVVLSTRVPLERVAKTATKI
ncbi:MAG: hypothetical protein KAR00_03605 [Candidatus Pacebacteria bacterium]|nr:hypothetical protein [Candidatus Paceibacterota bacterium]